MKSKVLIQIFPMVTDIDYLERTLLLLKQNSVYVDKDKFHIILDVALPISDYLTNWKESTLKQDYFIDKFNNLKKYADWADEYHFHVDEQVLGCVDYCIKNINKYKDIDNAIWLDTDIIFNPYTLSLMLESSLEIKKLQPKYIITPEFVKLWDGSWDVVTNDNFIFKNYGYEKTNDSIIDVMSIDNDISLEPLIVNNKKLFKFAGSWFTLYSKELLNTIVFPEDAKGYSPIDTYIMSACSFIPDVTQYKVKNLIVCEDYKHTNRTLYSKYVKVIDRKMEFYNEVWNKFVLELQKLSLK